MQNLIVSLKKSITLKEANNTQDKIENLAFLVIATTVIIAVFIAVVLAVCHICHGDFNAHNFEV